MTTPTIPLNTTKNAARILGYSKGETSGPTLVFFAGIHGNEQAGVKAITNVLDSIAASKQKCYGELFAFSGNLKALDKEVRYVDEDLNRIWLPHRLEKLKTTAALNEEELEMKALHSLIAPILHEANRPLYFFDIHTTSGESSPFIVVNDSILNRRFTKMYPVPKILGIEEYLQGALLSYLNEFGHIAFGFEAGQHNDPKSIANATYFIWLSLMLTNFIDFVPSEMEKYLALLANGYKGNPAFYEIYYQHLIPPKHNFKMHSGYVNFQKIKANTIIAVENGVSIKTNKNRQIFMPLYQSKGAEGFYFIRQIPAFFLGLSKVLRLWKVDQWFTYLPGISWVSLQKDVLQLNLKIARFFTKPLAHLFGFRVRQVHSNYVLLKSRERNAKTKDYLKESWYQKNDANSLIKLSH